MTLKMKPFENIVGKAENASNKHFSFSHIVFYPSQHKFQFFSCLQNLLCLQIHSVLDLSKFCGLVKGYLFNTQSRVLPTLRKKSFEDIAGKGENAGNQHFLLFPQCFLPYQ